MKTNINFAGKKALEQLKGIGPELAEAIIAYRTTFGLFKKIGDLKKVSGINQSLIDKIKDNIIIEVSAPLKPPKSKQPKAISDLRQEEMDKDYSRFQCTFTDTDGSKITYKEFVEKFGDPFKKKGA